MNTEIANIILSQISSLEWIDKYSGMTRTVVKSEYDGTKYIKKYFPIACSVTDSECESSDLYKDLCPDTKYKSVLYFEDLGVQVLGSDAINVNCRANLKLVCWLNGKKLGYDGCGLSAIAVMGILKKFALLFNPFNSGNFTRIQINAVSEDTKSPAIFSKYSYDEQTTQYLMYPFDYFALTLRVDFSIPFNCISDFEQLSDDIC